VHLRAEFVQVAAFERDAALAAILHNQRKPMQLRINGTGVLN
jgi:hypothetical protein